MQRAFFVTPIPRGLSTAAARPLAVNRVGFATRASAGDAYGGRAGGDREQRPIDKAREASMARSHEEKSAAARKAAETRRGRGRKGGRKGAGAAGDREQEQERVFEAAAFALEMEVLGRPVALDPAALYDPAHRAGPGGAQAQGSEQKRTPGPGRTAEERSEAARKGWATRRAASGEAGEDLEQGRRGRGGRGEERGEEEEEELEEEDAKYYVYEDLEDTYRWDD
eukprot:tig00000144_g9110.t1